MTEKSPPSASKVLKSARKPPNAGKGRVKGVPNKTTATVKAALLAVYEDLQESAGGNHGHLLKWAMEKPSDFYALWGKLIPAEVKAELTGADGAPLPASISVAFIQAKGEGS